MFKNLSAFRIQDDWHPSLSQAEAALKKFRFAECGATQAVSAGWVEPRGEKHGQLVEAIGDQWMLSLCIQSKLLPTGVVKEEVDKRIEQISHREGRRPGKKEVREIKESVILDLLPKAFSKKELVSIWIDRKNKLVVIDTASQSKCDSTTSALIKSLDGLAIGLLQTQMSPSTCMSQWLLDDDPPASFSVDSECELKSNDERRSAVKYSRHQLDTDEVKQHLTHGKSPTQLAMTWSERVSFVLTGNMALKKVAFIETPLMKKKAGGDEDPFDGNGAIVTGELSKLIPDLIEALGGEAVLGENSDAGAAGDAEAAREAHDEGAFEAA